MFYVYIDFTTEFEPRPFYVGKGLLPRLKRVFRNHRHQCILNALGLERRVHLETTDEAMAFLEEQRLIKLLKTHVSEGFGANYTFGGEGASGRRVSIETRHAISNALLGHEVTESARLKMSEAINRWLDQPGSREKLSKVRQARQETREERQHRYTRKQLALSDETKNRIANSMLGRVITDDTKAKMSESAKKKMASVEARELRSKALQGIVRSEETRAKLRAAWARRKEKTNEQRTVARRSDEEVRGSVESDVASSSSVDRSS